MKSLLFVIPLAAIAISSTPEVAAAPAATSGIYLSAADYTEHRLSFEGEALTRVLLGFALAPYARTKVPC